MNNQTNKERFRLYSRLFLRILFFAIFIISVIIFLPKIASLFAPFVAALVVSVIINPLVGVIHKKIRIPRQVLSLVFVLIIFGGIAIAAIFGVSALIDQVSSLENDIPNMWKRAEMFIETQNKNLSKIYEFLPDGSEEIVSGVMNNALTTIQTSIGGFVDSFLTDAMNIVTKIGGGAVDVVIFIIAAFLLTSEYPKISRKLADYISKTFLYKHIKLIRDATKSAFGGYVKAQLLLSLIAFAIMSVALSIAGQKYAILIAFLLAVVDFIPIIGIIAALTPWGIITIINGEIGYGIFLLILGVSFFILRKVLEPKIVGSQTGLSPLVALISIYLGLKLFGIWGAVFGPIVVMIIVSIAKAGAFDETAIDIKAVVTDIRSIFWRKKPNEAVLVDETTTTTTTTAKVKITKKK